MEYFAKDYTGAPMALFDTVHLLTLALIALLTLALLPLRSASPLTRRRARYAIAIILWLNEIGYHIWHLAWGLWTVQTMIPLQVCSVMVWLGGWGLITKNETMYEFMYFLGIGGALQALLTPDVGIYGFPHYRYFQTFISHGLIITSAVFLTVVEGMRPTWRSIVRVFVGTNLYMLLVYLIDVQIGANYLFLVSKPPTASVLDMLPPWPYYLLYMEAMGVVTFLLLYLPFAFRPQAKGGAA